MTSTAEDNLIEKIKSLPLPQHVAIIMDGNGRWAAKRRLTRLKGHQAGAEAIRRTITAARNTGIHYLTLYAFSTENWKRPKTEISGLFNLMTRFLQKETPQMIKNNIRLLTIGDLSKIPEKPRKTLEDTIQKTSHCQDLTVIVALNYGSRQEIARAFERLLETKSEKDKNILPEDIEKFLYTSGIPDPELLIRTSGEMRLSNFLLWQISYAELYFTQTLWPDYNEVDFFNAVIDFQKRKRRFGGL
ncbi:MAG: isoprenyl transferase [Candidatus Aureabacteria bacterium]|nr:isoprenyl transferase [Candidatus Auribacterota bacterium]